jgi:ketosteroid isomerase-like protein
MPRSILAIAFALLVTLPAAAQLDTAAPATPSPQLGLTDPTLTPDLKILYDLERDYQSAVAKAGGAAYAAQFADDGVVLSNKHAAVQGKTAIAAIMNWKPSDYELTWHPDGARMLPGSASGFTWGSYQGRGKDAAGNLVVTTGRYMSLWEKGADGKWKVLMDASNEAPPEPSSCCSIH